MSSYEVIYSGKVFALYSQVALFAADVKDSYPQWKTGTEMVIFGSHGVAVSTINDQAIDVFVCKGKGTPEHKLCVSGEILVGDHGIIVGNIPSANFVNLPLQSGRYSIIIYTDEIGIETGKVYFFIDRLDDLI